MHKQVNGNELGKEVVFTDCIEHVSLVPSGETNGHFLVMWSYDETNGHFLVTWSIGHFPGYFPVPTSGWDDLGVPVSEQTFTSTVIQTHDQQ